MRGSAPRGERRRTAIVGIAGAVMLASLAGACLASSRATEPLVANGPALPPPLSAGPPASAHRPPRSFTVVATGDILPSARDDQQVDRQVEQQAADGDGTGGVDYRRALGPIVPLISDADLAICHLDRPLAPARGPYPGRSGAGAPPRTADALAGVGYDACALASEHALDMGPGGVARTVESLDRVRLRHAGMARGPAEAAAPTIMNVKGVRVALVSAADGGSGARPPRAVPWLTDRIDPGRILATARRARRAGARVVIVSLDWGRANRPTASPRQIALAQRLLASPCIDLIVGQGAHVVQPFGRATNGKLVAYGMGDLVAAPDGGNTPGRNHGLAAGIVTRFTFAQGKGGGWRVTRAAFVPTYLDPRPPQRVVNVTAALADPRLPRARRQLLQGVLRRTMRTVYSRGAAPAVAR